MALDEVTITKAIVESYMESFLKYTDVDVALVGAGPANLVAAKKLAEADAKTVVFERNLSVGGGIWGGGMMFPGSLSRRKGAGSWMSLGSGTESTRRDTTSPAPSRRWRS